MNDFDTLTINDIALLRLSALEWGALAESRNKGEQFTWNFPHAMARNAKKDSLVIIEIEAPENKSDDEFVQEGGLKVGLVKSIGGSTTFDSRVSFDLIRDLSEASLQELFAQIPESTLKASIARLSTSRSKFEKISKKLGERLVELMLKDPMDAEALRPIVWKLNLPKSNRNAKALQVDAVKLALKAFGATDTDAVEIHLSSSDTALAGVRLQEDAVIEHDARDLEGEGWSLDKSQATGWAKFTRGYGREALEVFTANKRPLEEIFGVDLIYLNQVRKSLVMVQYKMLEPSEKDWANDTHGEKEWTVRIDQQFKTELGKMTVFDKDLDPTGAYRLNPSAFYFKLVKRDAKTNTAGFILSREHLQLLIDGGILTGPKGGLKISYKELDGHYIRSGGFVELVRSGYIGSRGATTEHLQTLMETALAEGRAVVGAIQSVLPYEPKRRSRVDEDFQPIAVDESMASDWDDDDI